MRFTIKREDLLKGLSTTSRAVSSKSANPVLKNIKIDLNEKGLVLTGSDFDLSIQTIIPYKQNDKDLIRNYKEGSVLINCKYFLEITRKLESEEIILDVIDTTIATISDAEKRSTFTLECIKPEEYPDLDLQANGVELTLTREQFSSLVSQTAFAASIKEQRPILTALNLEAGEGNLTATATDSARMARKIISIPYEVDFVSNVPAKMMIEIDRLLDTQATITMAFSDKKALFSLGQTIIATRLIDGDYPNTKNIVPRTTNYALEVNANDLIKAIDRANILSLERENVVDLSMSDNGIEISSKSAQVGSAVEKIELFKYEGNPLRISFNSEFVLAAIKSLSCEDVTLAFVGEMKPFVIKNASDDSVVQVVTPVRTY